MGFAEILALIKGVLDFPKLILEFVKLVRKTPQEQHEAILKRITEEKSSFEETGRPRWD